MEHNRSISGTSLTLVSGPGIRPKTGRGLVACGLWLHLGFIGLAGMAAGLVQLVDGSLAWPWALSLVSLGSMLAIAGWRRGWIVLGEAERVAIVERLRPAKATPAPVPARPVAARRRALRSAVIGPWGRT